MGRPAKPLAAHILQGTARMQRHAGRVGELSLEEEIGPAPKCLSAGAAKEWRRLAKHHLYGKVLTSLDRDALMDYCDLHDRHERTVRLRKELEECAASENFSQDEFERKDRTIRAIQPTASERQIQQSLRMQLGLTPASRSKVRLPEKPKANKWEVLKQGPTPIGA